MGVVAFLHPKDVLRDGCNHMPSISLSPSTNKPLKSRVTNPNSGSNSKAVSSSNRRKRSPQKKTTKLAQKRSNFDRSVNVSQKEVDDLSKSPQENSNFAHNFKVSQKKIKDFDQKVNSGSGLPSVLAKGGANFSNGKISSCNKLVMEKVKILKRGEVLTNDQDTKEKESLSDKESTVNLENNAVSNTEKKVLFDKENKYLNAVNIEKNGDVSTEKKMVLFNRGSKNNKKVFPEKNEDLKPNVDLDSVKPEPEMVPKHIQIADCYASAAFVASPDPSSLPYPPFLKKGVAEIELTPKISYSNDNVSSHLRRLLNLAF